jgi:hypothetical protein
MQVKMVERHPEKGGHRRPRRLTVEVRFSWMTWKCAVIDVPFGGRATGRSNPGGPTAAANRASGAPRRRRHPQRAAPTQLWRAGCRLGPPHRAVAGSPGSLSVSRRCILCWRIAVPDADGGDDGGSRLRSACTKSGFGEFSAGSRKYLRCRLQVVSRRPLERSMPSRATRSLSARISVSSSSFMNASLCCDYTPSAQPVGARRFKELFRFLVENLA